jgi:hypothetical protein
MEGLLPNLYGADAVEIPGARSLLQDLIARSAPWTIVTSGTLPLVTGVSTHPANSLISTAKLAWLPSSRPERDTNPVG